MKIKNLSIVLLSTLITRSYAFNATQGSNAEDSRQFKNLNCGDYFHYEQERNNKTHPQNYQCKTYLSPKYINKNNPDNTEEVTMFFGHHQATKTKKGTIFINHGGPGTNSAFALHSEIISGSIPKELLENFDIIGLDPRGTGASEYAIEIDKCFYEGEEPKPKYIDFCKDKDPREITQVGTNNYIADMEVLRKLLNEEKIHFIGKSYGGTVGMQYAHQHKESIGALVLDDPAAAKIFSRKQDGLKKNIAMNLSLLHHAKTRVAWFIKKAFEFDENQGLQNLSSLAKSIFERTEKMSIDDHHLDFFDLVHYYITMREIEELFYVREFTILLNKEMFDMYDEITSLYIMWGEKPKANWNITEDGKKFDKFTEKQIISDLFFKTYLQEEDIITILKAAKKYYFISPIVIEESSSSEEIPEEVRLLLEITNSNYIESNSFLFDFVSFIDRNKTPENKAINNTLQDVDIKDMDALLIVNKADYAINPYIQAENLQDLENSTKIIITNGHGHCSVFSDWAREMQHIRQETKHTPKVNMYDQIDNYVVHYIMNYGKPAQNEYLGIEKGKINEIKNEIYDARHFQITLEELNHRLKRVEAMLNFLDKLKKEEIKY